MVDRVFDRPFGDVLDGARSGDEASFAALWRWLQPSLLRYLRLAVAADPEDVASEVWISVARGLDAFVGGPDELRAWVFSVARRRAIDDGRRRARQAPVATDVDVSEDREGDVDLEAEALRQEALDGALALVRALPPDQADVVALRVIAELSVTETAVLLGRTPGSVRVLCHRGLARLAQRLERRDLVDL